MSDIDSIKPLTQPLILYSLVRDVYLSDSDTWDNGAIELNKGERFYKLAEGKTVLFTDNKAVFHRNSGLLFMPMPGLTYDAVNKALLENSRMVEVGKENLVYDCKSLAVYERTLALMVNNEDDDENAENWILPRMPVSYMPCSKIRRALPEELPLLYRAKYQKLLAQLE